MRTQVKPLTTGEVEYVVGSAVMAPSILNCQPWRFHAHDDVIEVHVDRDRAPSALDPQGREVLISVGAALLNLRLALLSIGRSPHLHLLPVADGGTLMAQLHIGGPSGLGKDELALFEAIPLRRSSRVPFEDRLVPFEDYLHLQEAAQHEGTYLDLITGSRRLEVVDLLHEASMVERADPEVLADIRRWTVDRPADSGIPDALLGPRPSDPAALVRDFGAGREIAGRAHAEFGSPELLAVLLTAADGPSDWLRAGMGLQRVLLTATARGVAVGFLSQASELPDLRLLLRDPRSAARCAQTVIRLGYETTPLPPSGRRPVADVLAITAPASSG